MTFIVPRNFSTYHILPLVQSHNFPLQIVLLNTPFLHIFMSLATPPRSRMSVLTQHRYSVSPSHRIGHQCQHRAHVPVRIYCATTTPTKPKLKSLIVEPRLSPALLTQPTFSDGPNPNDPTLQSTWAHRAWLASGCTTVLIAIAKSVTVASESHICVEPILAGLTGYLLADLGSGFYHWGIDNYGDATTPIFGAQIEAFQGHHKWPWTITRRGFANNLHSLARSVTLMVLPMDLMAHDPTLNAFIAVCSGCIMMSQQFHAWAHSTKSKLPQLVVSLQEMGMLVSRSQHAAHHRPPYNGNYCIVSGIWNKVLDENKVFEVLEMVLFFKLGVRPRSWSEPGLEWTEETESSSSFESLAQ